MKPLSQIPRKAWLVLPVAIGLVFLVRNLTGSGEETVEVARGEAVQAVYATGEVEPTYWAKLSSEEDAVVVEILKDEGEHVAPNDVVIRLNASTEKARLDEAQARLAFLEKDVARQRDLAKRGAASKRQMEDTEREYEEAKARVDLLSHEVEQLMLRSPIEGVVLRRDIELGEIAPKGQGVVWVGKPLPLRITAEVDEEDIGIVMLGQKALIKADAFPGKVFEGTVSEITPKGDPVNKVFRIRVALPDDTPLLVGMTVEVNIITRTVKDALLIPIAAERDGMVWKVDVTGIGRVPVKIGIRGDKRIEVLEGLEEGDSILATAPVDGR